jgi:hypothetical protein
MIFSSPILIGLEEFQRIPDIRKELRVIRQGEVLIQLFTNSFLGKYEWFPKTLSNNGFSLLLMVSNEDNHSYQGLDCEILIEKFDQHRNVVILFFPTLEIEAINKAIQSLLKMNWGLKFWSRVIVEASIIND